MTISSNFDESVPYRASHKLGVHATNQQPANQGVQPAILLERCIASCVSPRVLSGVSFLRPCEFDAAQGMEHVESARRMIAGDPWPATSRSKMAQKDRPQNVNKKEANKGSSQPQAPVPEIRRGPPPISPAAQERVVRLWPRCCVVPVGVRFDTCAQFVERARNRLSRADEALRKAQDERVRLEQELQDGEHRLEAFRVEASEQRTPQAGGPGDEVSRMQKMLNQLASAMHCPRSCDVHRSPGRGAEMVHQI